LVSSPFLAKVAARLTAARRHDVDFFVVVLLPVVLALVPDEPRLSRVVETDVLTERQVQELGILEVVSCERDTRRHVGVEDLDGVVVVGPTGGEPVGSGVRSLSSS
jgi:hypothetical protein